MSVVDELEEEEADQEEEVGGVWPDEWRHSERIDAVILIRARW